MGKIVAKFGGSSLCDASQFRKVKSILLADEKRSYVVPSAPGRRFPEDEKVTDLLYKCHRLHAGGADFSDVFSQIRERYMSIAQELSLKVDIASALDEVEQDIRADADSFYCASRGEYLCGLLLSDFMGWPFLDSKDFIFFQSNGTFDAERTNIALSTLLKYTPRAVIPGFYGSIDEGCIYTFSRGGSDITGAIVARAAKAELYENWTDVPGFLMADPHIVPDAKTIRNITYRELRELSYMGATVLHEDSIFPVHRAGIPTIIRNTNDPDGTSTLITKDFPTENNPYIITGVAGRTGYSVISVEKAMMKLEIGFGRKVLQAIEEKGLSFEQMPTGIDSLCVVVETARLAPVRDAVVKHITELAQPDSITVHDSMAMIATVGTGMVHSPGTAARLFSALSRENVNVRMIDQGSSELSILVGVDEKDFRNTIRAIYSEFVKD